jgi:aconitase A
MPKATVAALAQHWNGRYIKPETVSPLARLLRRYPLTGFFLLAYALTWPYMIVDALGSHGLLSSLPTYACQAGTPPFAVSCVKRDTTMSARLHHLFDTLQEFNTGRRQLGQLYSLPQLERAGVGPISQLPVSIRIVLESVLRNYDGKRITETDIGGLANWQANAARTAEVPFVVARIVLQDFTGVPLLVDLAAMRSAAARLGRDPGLVEPLVPVDLVIDHSVQVDFSEVSDALQRNMAMEFKRNQARYRFLKWGTQAFNGFSVIPPGIGIVHQVNLEYLARGVLEKGGVYYPDTLVGTDSHTTMINGLGVVGWGVGGIEAEAGMLGQPIYLLTPDVVGVHLLGALQAGVTATDLVLRITELLRQTKVVGKFVEFHGEGAASLSLTEIEMMQNRPTPDRVADVPAEEFPQTRVELCHGDVVIAAITSCTNTSNPSVMIAAGLLAKKAVEHGMTVRPAVKTSLAPGSRVVTAYLTQTGLQTYLDQLGFQTVGYGCTTCIGNSGPLEPHLEETIAEHDLVVASVLSGNRNFEARVHQSIKANFLMSPPLVVAFALAGRIGIDMANEPLGQDRDGNDIYLRDLWPSAEEIGAMLHAATDPETYCRLYRDFADQNPLWAEIPSSTGKIYAWDPHSTYIQEPPYFTNFSMAPGTVMAIQGARPLAILGDSVTTDHISPAGAIKPASPAGRYLQEQGVAPADFNSYGARRGNDQVMVRGTFANVRIKNLMVVGVEGGVTLHQPSGEQMSIYDAALRYQAEGTGLVIIAGQEYGTGSSRDWAAKGTRLLGVQAVIAQSFERIHRSNLVGMGVLPCQFAAGDSAQSLGFEGTETFDLLGLEQGLRPGLHATLVVHRASGATQEVPITVRIDTPIEVDYYLHGGILPYVLRQLMRRTNDETSMQSDRPTAGQADESRRL